MNLDGSASIRDRLEGLAMRCVQRPAAGALDRLACRLGAGIRRSEAALAIGVLVSALGLGAPIPASAMDVHFRAEDIAAWPTRSFEGETDYRLVTRDGATVLQARPRGQASARYLERSIDLTATPYLHWCWQIARIYPGLDETTKAGDDYPARVYVVRRTGVLPWQVQSVNYVWSSTQPAGARWPNAFTSRAHLIAVQGGEARVGEWIAEVRDVRADFQAMFGDAPARIDGIALMSDGDNAGVDGTSWYAHIGFSDSAEPSRCP